MQLLFTPNLHFQAVDRRAIDIFNRQDSYDTCIKPTVVNNLILYLILMA